MTKVTRGSGMRRYRASWARLPRSRSGASLRSQRPSARSSRVPASALSRIWSSISVPHRDHVVEGVALDRDLARVADDAQDLLLRQPGGALRLRHVGDLLL